MASITQRIRDICRVQPGYAGQSRLSPTGPGRGLPVVTLADVGADGLPDPADLRRFTPPYAMDRYLVRAGDVVFRSRADRPTAAALDERYGEPCVAVLPLFILQPDQSRVLPEYLTWAINRPVAQHHLARVARGAAMQVILRRGIESLRVALPGLREQRRIVKINRAADREFRLAIAAAEARRGLAARVVEGLAEGVGAGRGAEGGTRWLA